MVLRAWLLGGATVVLLAAAQLAVTRMVSAPPMGIVAASEDEVVVQQLGGAVAAVEVSSGRIIVSQGPRIAVYTLAAGGDRWEERWQSDVLPDVVFDFERVDGYLYVAGGAAGLHVFEDTSSGGLRLVNRHELQERRAVDVFAVDGGVVVRGEPMMTPDHPSKLWYLPMQGGAGGGAGFVALEGIDGVVCAAGSGGRLFTVEGMWLSGEWEYRLAEYDWRISPEPRRIAEVRIQEYPFVCDIIAGDHGYLRADGDLWSYRSDGDGSLELVDHTDDVAQTTTPADSMAMFGDMLVVGGTEGIKLFSTSDGSLELSDEVVIGEGLRGVRAVDVDIASDGTAALALDRAGAFAVVDLASPERTAVMVHRDLASPVDVVARGNKLHILLSGGEVATWQVGSDGSLMEVSKIDVVEKGEEGHMCGDGDTVFITSMSPRSGTISVLVDDGAGGLALQERIDAGGRLRRVVCYEGLLFVSDLSTLYHGRNQSTKVFDIGTAGEISSLGIITGTILPGRVVDDGYLMTDGGRLFLYDIDAIRRKESTKPDVMRFSLGVTLGAALYNDTLYYSADMVRELPRFEIADISNLNRVEVVQSERLVIGGDFTKTEGRLWLPTADGIAVIDVDEAPESILSPLLPFPLSFEYARHRSWRFPGLTFSDEFMYATEAMTGLYMYDLEPLELSPRDGLVLYLPRLLTPGPSPTPVLPGPMCPSCSGGQ